MADDTHNQISGGIFFSAVIQGRDITVQLPPQITPALSGLPAGSTAFTGREAALHTLLTALTPHPTISDTDIGDHDGSAVSPPSRPVVVTAVGGLAGIGKTELAIQAAHTALTRGWFPGGVLFVDLFGYDPARRIEPGQALEGFLRALGIPGEHIPPQVQDRARLYASVLTAYAHHDRRILLMIDNASTHEQAQPLLPTDGATTAIVTSRDILAMLGARLLNLDVLPDDEAVQLLDHALRVALPADTRVTAHPGDAAAIARLCGGLPLALQIVAALLAENPARPMAAMAADLSDARGRLEELQHTGVPGVRAAFDLSYQRLTPDLARVFRLLPVNPGPDISTPATAIVTGLDQSVCRRGLEALARAHLIEPGGAYGRWRMHDLVRLHADQHGRAHAERDGRAQAFTWLLEHYLTTTAAANAHLNPQVADPAVLGFGNRRQALAWLDAEYPNLTAATYAAAGSQDHAAVARDLQRAMWDFLLWRRHFNDWITLSATARDAARHLGDRHGEATALTSLGTALTKVRRFEEAITTHQDAAQICREIGDRQGEGQALGNLGTALQEVRRFKEAITAHQQDLQICRDTGDRYGEAQALNNLGTALYQVRRFEEAITTHQDAAQICREIGDRQGEGQALGNLGTALHEVRRFEEAITAHRKDLQICREIGDRHGEGRALNNLGAALREMRRFEDAITAYLNAAQIYRDTSDQHREGGALNNLGNALQQVRQFEEAITAHQDAAQIYRELGDRHSEATALTSLGNALQRVRQFEEAITAYQDAAQIFHNTRDEYSEGITLNNLETAQQAQRSAHQSEPS